MKRFRAFVCYLDLLGTKARFQRAIQQDSAHDYSDVVGHELIEMSNATSILKKHLGEPITEDVLQEHGYGASFASDCAYVIAKADAPIRGIGHTDNESEFGNLIFDVTECLSDLILNGYLARGRMTIGEVGLDGTVLSGPAICEAGTNEKNICGPFVEVTPQVFSFIAEGSYWQRGTAADPSGDVMEECNLYRRFLLEEKTGAVILNHMWEWFCSDVDTERYLSGQKRAIELWGPVTEQSQDKYRKLAALHNYAITTEIPDMPKEHRPRFYISKEIQALLGSGETPSFTDLHEWMRPIRKAAFERVIRKRLDTDW